VKLSNIRAFCRSSNRTVSEMISINNCNEGWIILNMTWSKLIVVETVQLLNLHKACMFHFSICIQYLVACIHYISLVVNVRC